MGTRVHRVRPVELEQGSPSENFSHPEGLFLMDGEEELRSERHTTSDAVLTKRRLEWLLTPPEAMVRPLALPSWYSAPAKR
jgi:hypothetical protein